MYADGHQTGLAIFFQAANKEAQRLTPSGLCMESVLHGPMGARSAPGLGSLEN